MGLHKKKRMDNIDGDWSHNNINTVYICKTLKEYFTMLLLEFSHRLS